MSAKIPLEVKLHIWLDGSHAPTTDDVQRRVVQHFFNNAIQRKRPLEINHKGQLALQFTKEETDVLESMTTLLEKINDLKIQVTSINSECISLSNTLDKVLDKYVNEVVETE